MLAETVLIETCKVIKRFQISGSSVVLHTTRWGRSLKRWTFSGLGRGDVQNLDILSRIRVILVLSSFKLPIFWTFWSEGAGAPLATGLTISHTYGSI